MTRLDHQPPLRDPSDGLQRHLRTPASWLVGKLADARGSFARWSGTLARNRLRLLLLVPASIYLVIVGGLLLQLTGILIAIALVALVNVLGPQISADTMLSLYRAEPVAPGQAETLRTAINTLSDRAGLAVEPALAIIPSLSTGAFAVGSDHRVAVLVTEGLLRRLGTRDLVAIAAHQIGHIKNGDLAVFGIADSLVRVAQLLCYIGVGLVIANIGLWFAGDPLFALLPVVLLLAAPMLNSTLQLILNRDHDFAADRTAALLLGTTDIIPASSTAAASNRGSLLDDIRLPVPQRHIPLPSPLRCDPDAGTRSKALAVRPPVVLLPPLAIPDEPMISLLGFGPVEMRPRNRWPGLWF